jgi:UDP-N-acetylmuramoyl-tripeptide--D-alanyl-D-alanine ligase
MAEPLWTRDEIAAATGGRAAGPAFATTGVSIDSRTLEPGDLFVALTGERDGHAFAAGALSRGAAGVLASAPVDGPAILVPDTLVGLEAMARAARDRASGARRGAVTGSVGKTTVTQLVRAGLARAGKAHGSVKSYNNHIGVPLTLARMPRDTERAVFEIGMNHAGEIAPLSRLVAPEAVAITNVEAVHVENFADGEAGVARAKTEIFEGLAPGGAAILNADNRWRDTLSQAARENGARVQTFGAAPGANARLMETRALDDGLDVTARIDGAEVAYRLRPSAPHWAPMSLCALLMMRALGVELATGLAAVAAFEPLEGRGAARTIRAAAGAFTLIDESYNASPVSVAAALAALGARKAGRRIAVLTDMLELGPDSPLRHAELAKAIEAVGIDLVFCAGPLMRSLWDALPASRQGRWAPAAADLAPCLARAVAPGDAVMVKGSRDSKAALLVEALVALDTGEGAGR